MLSSEDVFQKIAQLSEKNKIASYVVGGFVRDRLLDKKEKRDIDFVVVGSGLAFAREFDVELNQLGSLVEFPGFDTARYIIKSSVLSPQSSVDGADVEEIILEFAGARSESYQSDSRKPVVHSATLEEDLSRRDFTVNAMAVSSSCLELNVKSDSNKFKKSIIDPFNGQKDLEEKVLRTPLDPNVTFSDDPLRMLRAIRFAAQLNFSIDPKTLEAIHANRGRLKIISGERVQEELLKLLATPLPSIGLILMFQTGLMDVVLPEISALDGVEEIYGHQHKNNLIHTFKVVDNIAERSDNVWLRFAGLLHDIGKPATKRFLPRIGWAFHAHEHVGRKMVFSIAKRLKLSNDHADYLAKLVRWHMQPIALMDEGITDSAVRRLIVTLGDEIDDLLILGRSDITTGNPYKKDRRLKNYDGLETRTAEVVEKDKLRAFQSPVRGEEIMELCGLKPGPTIGKIKEAIEEAILDGIIPNEYEPAKEYFLKIKEEYLKDVKDWEKKV
jgi:poly(A) polymerase